LGTLPVLIYATSDFHTLVCAAIAYAMVNSKVKGEIFTMTSLSSKGLFSRS
jgi:hypothetical protein